MAIELRHWREEDAEALERAVNESADHLRPWMPWVGDEPAGVEARRAWIAEVAAGDEQAFGVFEDGRVVGGAGLHPRIGEGGLEIGYWVHAAHTRRGMATEAVRLLIELRVRRSRRSTASRSTTTRRTRPAAAWRRSSGSNTSATVPTSARRPARSGHRARVEAAR